MSRLTELKAQEQLSSLTNAEEASSKGSFELLEKEPIGGTPFHIVGNRVDGYFLVLGKYRLTDVKNSKDEVVEELQGSMWNIVLNLVVCIVRDVDEIRELKG